MRLNRRSSYSWRPLGCAAVLLLIAGWLFSPMPHMVHSVVMTAGTSICNSTLGFQKILVLNLPERTDRADWMRLIAAASQLQIEFVDGVDGDKVPDKVLPFPPHRDLGRGNIGSWRAHLNAMTRIVSEGITSALIMEDDVDWDVRIKKQMEDFARGTRALLQPIKGSTKQYADSTFLDGRPDAPQHRHELLEDDSHYDFSASTIPQTTGPQISPYGDDWDVLWPGHCTMHFARAQDRVPKGRYLIYNDTTMLPNSEIISGDPKVWPINYPERSRVVHHVWDPVCTYAYAVSQRGARKILWEFGLKRFDRAFDNMMSEFCDMHVCLTIQPQLFSAYAAPGPISRDSEINGFGQDQSSAIREQGRSENIQRSVRLNLPSMLDGVPEDELKDQYPTA